MVKKRVSLGKRLRHCPSVDCVGVQPNWSDYPEEVRERIAQSSIVYYPSRLYEDLFRSLGKRVFPQNYYGFMGHKIRQTALFQLLDVPHPRTKLYYGSNRAERIERDFSYPFIAKNPVGSSQGEGVWLVHTPKDLEVYLDAHHPAYIQEYLPIDRDLRVVLIGQQVVHAYWRVATAGEFRNNVSRGGSIDFEHIPQEGLDFARWTATVCRFDEAGLDICFAHGRWWVLEANMVYGLEGFRRRGLDIYAIFRSLDEGGAL